MAQSIAHMHTNTSAVENFLQPVPLGLLKSLTELQRNSEALKIHEITATSLSIRLCVYIYKYIHMYVCMHIHVDSA